MIANDVTVNDVTVNDVIVLGPRSRASGAALAFDAVAIDRGARRVLSGATFAIPSGAFVAVLGPNGAGKTTLMRAVLGLTPTAAGRITVAGEAPRRGNAAIGYMPQFRRGAAQLGLTGFDLVLGALGGGRWGRPFASRADRRLAADALAGVDLVLYLGGGGVALGTVDEVINADVLTRLYGTPIHVAKLDGRIYVMARDGDLATHRHPDSHGARNAEA